MDALKVDTHVSILQRIYEAMLEIYRGPGSPEERAEKVLEYYDLQGAYMKDLQDHLSKVLDLYHVVLESLRQLREAREAQDRKGRTIRGSGCIVSKLVPCGKQCNGCPHGPYLYRVQKVGGKQIWTYLGRA